METALDGGAVNDRWKACFVGFARVHAHSVLVTSRAPKIGRELLPSAMSDLLHDAAMRSKGRGFINGYHAVDGGDGVLSRRRDGGSSGWKRHRGAWRR